MGCKRYKRWVSDDMDGALTLRRRAKLLGHLSDCPDCRGYHRRTEAIQSAARKVLGPDVSPDYWPESFGRIAAKVRAEAASRRAPSRRAFLRSPGWAWAGAASLLAAGVGLFLLLSPARVGEAIHPLAFEDPWASLEGPLFEDAEAAQAVASSLQSALAESLREFGGEVAPLLDGEALFLEDLTDEEVLLVNAELAKEIVD
ncbi:MAG: zf-HC2 domain-containing protein [Candidatus Aminicenantes bacterium]|nr:zf-HC2 domain-containing protein [Candidatus Aminicenantes bacterium]